MGHVYSTDIRTRVVAAVCSGASCRSAARRFSVSESSAIRWVRRAKLEGRPTARKLGRPAGKGPLADHLSFLIRQVEVTPDITMPELARRMLADLGVHAHPASLSRLLCRAGFTYKKTIDGLRVRTR